MPEGHVIHGIAAALAELFSGQVVHPNPLVPMLTASLGAPDAVFLDMRKLPFDRIRMP